jgi:glycosyltransferase involved in cell wall biosynthesis
MCYRFITTKLFHFNAHDGLREFKGKTDCFRDVRRISFHPEEIIVGVGMWASAQLSSLGYIPNPKLLYIHGEHIGEYDDDRNLREEVLSSPIPKVVVSNHLKQLMQRLGGKEILGVVHNAINRKDYFDCVDESLKDGIGTIYSSHPAKDPETILDVIDSIRMSRPDIPIRVFGSGRRPARIKRSWYWRLPSVEKAREIYSKSQIWIMASKSEGFSLPILEAMACGAVPVATDCGGPREIIIDGENGFLVPVGGVEEIVDRVFLLLKDETLRNRMRLKAQETVNEFSWDRSINDLEKTLNGISLKHKLASK